MSFDITKPSEAEVIELNRRIVERLQLMRSAKSLTQLARFSVAMAVEFDAADGRTITSTVARLKLSRNVAWSLSTHQYFGRSTQPGGVAGRVSAPLDDA